MLESIATAADDLSRHRIGALIVLERETGLSDYIETGIQIDALITAELFENIFIPKLRFPQTKGLRNNFTEPADLGIQKKRKSTMS